MSAPKLIRQDFNYELPQELVAQHPPPARDGARLLVWDNGTIHHSRICNIHEHVPKGTLFIVNDSKVIPSRIRFNLETGAAAEFLLLEPVQDLKDSGQEAWLALTRPMRKMKQGQIFDVGHGLQAQISALPLQDSGGPGAVTLKLSIRGPQLLEWLGAFGEMPLPPYIERKSPNKATSSEDIERYQTVYAADCGSVAAPTAGLHFTPNLLDSLTKHGCEIAKVTLHVGAGTFLPVKVDELASHPMHSERFMIPSSTLAAIHRAKRDGRKVVVVGTTALRSLEGFHQIASKQNVTVEALCDQWLRTNIFIYPSHRSDAYKSWVADGLMTNFHQPESTLLMLVSSLVGYDHIKSIYQSAIAERYRFFSYGDTSLLWL